MEEAKYLLAVHEARGLLKLPKGRISINEREVVIQNIVRRIYLGNKEDEGGLRDVASEAVGLMRTYPLSLQESGTVVRAQRYLKEIQWERGIANERREGLQLKNEELMDIQVGDWKRIQNVFKLSQGRERIWKESIGRNITNPKPLTVYRGMTLEDQDVEIIKKYGLAPEGLRRYLTVDEVVYQQIKFFWGSKDWPNTNPERMFDWILGKIPISTVNLLHEVYEEGEFGTSSPFKLGISTTSTDNLRERNRRFFGNYLFRIQLPGNLLIRTNDKPLEDEHTAMYYIPPDAITGCTIVPENNNKPLTKTLPPHTWYRDIFRLGKKVGIN
jgi:hypothetical protein